MNISPMTPCTSCTKPATYRRFCGYFYCDTCLDSCDDPITHRYSKDKGQWVECDEEGGEVSHVTITIEGADEREVETVEKAIGQMMHEKFKAFRSEVVSSVGFDRDF